MARMFQKCIGMLNFRYASPVKFNEDTNMKAKMMLIFRDKKGKWTQLSELLRRDVGQ